jgi:hypothetical protein
LLAVLVMAAAKAGSERRWDSMFASTISNLTLPIRGKLFLSFG